MENKSTIIIADKDNKRLDVILDNTTPALTVGEKVRFEMGENTEQALESEALLADAIKLVAATQGTSKQRKDVA